MEFLANRFAKKTKTLRMPDGRLVKLTEEPTGLTAVIQQLEDGDRLHGLVRPEPLSGRMAWQ